MKYFLSLLLLFSSAVYAKKPEPSVWLYNLTDNISIVNENADVQRPLASITKLMTAMVTLDANQNLDVKVIKTLKGPLPPGEYTLKEILAAALIKSDNSSAETLAENYPGGRAAFIKAMNSRAQALGMNNTSFEDVSGLSPNNVSSAQDINKMLIAAMNYPVIHNLSIQTQAEFEVFYKKRIRKVVLHHTSKDFLFEFDNIYITKTGFTNPAGFCLALVVEKDKKYYTVIIMGTPNTLLRLNLVRRLLNIDINYNHVLDTDLR